MDLTPARWTARVPWWGPGRRPGPPAKTLLDACLGTHGCVTPRADICRLGEARGEDVLDVALVDRLRCGQDGLHRHLEHGVLDGPGGHRVRRPVVLEDRDGQ